jgi:hypothetical protein
MRTQLYQALLNKARRGELATWLPVGYERLDDGQVVFTPNQEVQSAIRLGLAQFERLGSARAVLLYCCQQHLELPPKIQSGLARGEIEWVKPSYPAISRLLHPAYAGAYTFGKKHNVRLPGHERKVVSRKRSLAEWPVLIQAAFPGYLTWNQYPQNQDRLRQNSQQAPWGHGAPGSGLGLLQGIACCGRCGRRLHPRYSNQPAYGCEVANTQYGEPRCQNFMVPHIDAAVTQIFLEAVQPVHREAALAALDQVEAHRHQLRLHWQQRLERARYEVELARRRYERVDPDHRRVATELERHWEEKLQAWQRLDRE